MQTFTGHALVAKHYDEDRTVLLLASDDRETLVETGQQFRAALKFVATHPTQSAEVRAKALAVFGSVRIIDAAVVTSEVN